MWLLFFAILTVGVLAGVAAYKSCQEPEDDGWRDRLLEYVEAAPVLVTYVAADGEVLEFATSRAWPWDEVAETLAAIERLPEVAA